MVRHQSPMLSWEQADGLKTQSRFLPYPQARKRGKGRTGFFGIRPRLTPRQGMTKKTELHTTATLARLFTGLAGRTTIRSWLATGRLKPIGLGGEGRLMEFEQGQLQKLRHELLNEKSSRLATAFAAGAPDGAGLSDEQLLDGHSNEGLSPEQRAFYWPEISRRMGSSVTFRKFMEFHQANKASLMKKQHQSFGNTYNRQNGRTEKR